MSEVSLSHVCKAYPDGFKAVDDFTLVIPDREFLVLVGPSGCGKSTTLRMVAGLEEISSGEIAIDGRVVNDVPAKDREIAMVFQNYALYPHMTVRENMAFGLKLRRLPRAEIQERVDEAASLLDIASLLDRLPKQLSGGQRQRVAVGRAIVRKPKVFLFDEPLSNLDAKMRVQMRVEISRLHRRLESTMIYVTHDQTEAMTMADRIVVMDGGRIQQVAAPMSLYHRPSNRFTAGFIGTPAMNFFEGRLCRNGSEYTFAGSGFTVALPDAWAAPLADASDGPATLGLRPEDVTCLDDGDPGGFHFEASVDVVEPMGAETCLYAAVGGAPFIARADGAVRVKPDERRRFRFHLASAHCFSPSGQAWV